MPSIVFAQASNGQLVEQYYVAVPDTFAPTGLELSANGTIVAWSQETGKAFRFDHKGGQRQLILPSGSQPVGGAISSNGIVEIFETKRASIYRFSSAGQLLNIQRTSVKSAYSAVKVSSSWFILQRLSGDTVVMLQYDTTGKKVTLHKAQLRAGEATSMTRGKDSHELLLANSRAPFAIKRLRLDSATIQVFNPRLPEAMEGPETWRALPLVAVKSGYIQTIADLLSDRRILVLYSPDGKTKAVRPLNAPIGMGAGNLSSSVVAAVRNLRAPEIVWYKWINETER